MKALKTDDLYAREISSNFQQLLENYRYLNFCETLPLKSFGLIVEMKSATLGLPDTRETVVALDADHESICRFASEDDDGYQRVSSLISGLATSAPGVFGEQSSVRRFNTLESTLVADEADPRFFIIPYSRNPEFIDPIEFAYRFSIERPRTSVFWVHASSIDRFQEGYCNILDECNVSKADYRNPNKTMLVREWLEREVHEWLLIIDNADEASLFTSEGNTKRGKPGTMQAQKGLSILDYLPECRHGSILITTRDRAAGVKFIRNCPQNLIEVGTMTKAESASLIKSTVTDNYPEESEMEELAGLLDHLPLAIVQATAFMEENTLAVNEYIELYNDSDETQMDLLCEPFETLGRDTAVPNALATTLMVSINHIKEQDTRAVEILSLIAFLDQYHIPKGLLQKKVKKALELTKALGTLKAFSLIVPSADTSSFSVHRLVQLVLQCEGTIEAMAQLGSLYLDLGKLDTAEGLIRGAWNWRRKARGAEHLDTWISDASLAQLYRAQGKLQEAEELIIKTIQTIENSLGSSHPRCLQNKSNLVGIYIEMQEWDNAEELLLQVLEGMERNHAVTYDILSNKQTLSTIYWHKGLVQESEKLGIELLKDSIRELGPSHPFTLKCKYFVAIYLNRHGKKAEAIELLIEVTNKEEDILGAFHDDTLMSIGTLSEWCGSDKAINMLLDAQEAEGDAGHISDDWEVINNLLGEYTSTV
ncbi:hypothetical protein BBP40_006056 [Aspergillus hancockii]|nr:hypothetical protein BBP40_006056 [Aspergillus hancockii]